MKWCLRLKGALTEQYVLQQLKTLKDVNAYYWTNDRGNAEIDFLIDKAANLRKRYGIGERFR